MMSITGKTLQIPKIPKSVRKKSFGGTFSFSNCHIIVFIDCWRISINKGARSCYILFLCKMSPSKKKLPIFGQVGHKI
jgi:hypothetical protein